METHRFPFPCIYLVEMFTSSNVACTDVMYCDEHVCLYICPLTYFGNDTRPDFTKFSVHVNCGHGLVMF